MVNLKINGIAVTAENGMTILEAARSAGIRIPTLCYLKEINQIGACRMCMVEVKGARSLVAACVYPVNEGMEVFTDTEKVIKSRKTTLELILSDHNKSCLSCVRSGNCELQALSQEYGCDATRFIGETSYYEKDTSTVYLQRDNTKCILCRRCVAACNARQEVAVIGANARGFDTHIACAFEQPLSSVPCVACGQCINVCPTGALTEKDDTQAVFDALRDPEKYVVVAPAPAVRAALGEEFGMPIGTNVEGKMVTAMRRLGFNQVFDINFAADLTIMEEGTEFIQRLSEGGVLPMITSCSPGWVKFCEHYFPEMTENLSTCKSPMQMYGAVVKTYFAEKNGLDPKNIVVVGVMPCTAKKFEKGRADQSAAGVPDVDYVITTREFARMVKKAGIMFNALPEGEFDAPLGIYTGAGLIFGASGGVMEAALRTVVEVVDKKTLENLDFTEVRGMEGIKEASYVVGGKEVKVAVASGLSNARKLLEAVKAGEREYHFIEIMCCPGGCVNGGGQPIQPADVMNNEDVRSLRAKVLYEADKGLPVRKSHENAAVQQLYTEYLGEPGSHKAHHILHTTYVKRGRK
ncbi:MAG: iron hydrogenase small subunit [Clostridia bacterium]|nr:iron hydrogenase small subunit [Clostridia bacterium]